MLGSAAVSRVGSPVARLTSLATDAQPCSYGAESCFAFGSGGARSPIGAVTSPQFAGPTVFGFESPRVGVVSSPRREGASFAQARAHTATREQRSTEGKVGAATSPRRVEEPTLYDVLGITEDAGVKEIKSAFRQLARRFHPDVAPEEQREECTKDFMKIHAAYITLSEPQSKASYDLQLSMESFQRNGYGGGRVASVNQNWDFPAAAEYTPSNKTWDFSAASGYSAPSSFNSQWKGRSWETDQCW